MVPNFRAVDFEGFQTVPGQVHFRSHQNRAVSQRIWTFVAHEHCVKISRLISLTYLKTSATNQYSPIDSHQVQI